MTTAKVSTALAAARADDSARRHDRVLRALDAMTTAGHEINVSAVARAKPACIAHSSTATRSYTPRSLPPKSNP